MLRKVDHYIVQAAMFLFLLPPNAQLYAQQTLNEVNPASYDNYRNTYNYTYWNDNWKTSVVDRSFTNHTNNYAFNINFNDLSINSLLIDESPTKREEAFKAPNTIIFPNNYAGDINYAIVQNGVVVIHEKSSSPTSPGIKDSQMAEYGVWFNNRFVSTNLTNNPSIDPYFTGVEFATWHNRFKLTFHVKPTATIVNSQLRFSIDMPTEYSMILNSAGIYAFGLATDKGFAVKAGESAASLTVNGNTISVLSSFQDLLANESYEVSILFYAITDNLAANYSTIFDQETEINITGTQTSTFSSDISDDVTYDSDQSIHYIDVPRINMGYFDCNVADNLQNIDFQLENSSNEEKRVRLCIRRNPSANVTGYNALICNENGDPAGLPLQVSKNWHTGTPQLFSGNWVREYTELIIPANTTLKFKYKSTGAKWGETYSASSHQLSVVGAGVPRGGWLEAALGTFGENITHSPDYEYGNTNGADIRPFLVTNQEYGGTSSQCGWTGNVGGVDMFIYNNDSGTRIYQSEVKTDFKKYSPNLTETSISAISSDDKLKLDYTFYLNRSDDFTRIYYKVRVEALQDANFNRFDLFQLGGDNYNVHNAQNIVYGDDTGMLGQFFPTNDGSNDYTTAELALTGTNPWLWAGDGLYFNGATESIDIDTNNGIIIRSYKASFDGVANNTPYIQERSSSTGFSASRGNNPTSYCLVTPPSVSSFKAGDTMSLLVEVAILPKQAADYYGPNINFFDALTTYGNSYELLYREASGNKIIAESPTNNIDVGYPLTIATNNNTGLVKITGGRGYVPLVFSDLSSITDPVLWKAEEDCWDLVDQSTHGKDFWQAEYDVKTGLYNLIFNVNQDRTNDVLAETYYYLGNNPPELNLIIQTQIVGNPWSLNPNVEVYLGSDSARLAPQANEFGMTSVAVNANYAWEGPNSFTQSGRVVDIYPVEGDDLGQYTCIYTSAETGCKDTIEHTITMLANLTVKFFLEGAYNGTDMDNAIQSICPTTQPYAPYYNGTETVTTVPANIVDWVLVELRYPAETVVATKAAFLTKDGNVVDLDGISPVHFSQLTTTDFYIAIKHRNHIGVLTSEIVELD